MEERQGVRVGGSDSWEWWRLLERAEDSMACWQRQMPTGDAPVSSVGRNCLAGADNCHTVWILYDNNIGMNNSTLLKIPCACNKLPPFTPSLVRNDK